MTMNERYNIIDLMNENSVREIAKTRGASIKSSRLFFMAWTSFPNPRILKIKHMQKSSQIRTEGTKYSRMDEVKFVEDSL